MRDAILAEHIATQLRRSILRGNFRPGEPIKERDQAAEMGVSRTPMREAIRMLANEGLLTLRPARSPIVTELSFQEVYEQTQVMTELEKFSAELACSNATDQDIAHLQSIVDVMDEQFTTTDPLDMFEIDMSFHKGLLRAAHNEALARTHLSFLERLWYYRYLAAVKRHNRERVISHHLEIVRAIRARNKEAARKAVDQHLQNLAHDIRPFIEMNTKTA